MISDIRSLTREEIREFFIDHNEAKFRADQTYDWLWRKSCTSFDDMTNLPASSRKMLMESFTLHSAKPEIQQKSSDGTVKVGFRLNDGLMVEGVLIPSGDRFTVCISSQVGCSMGCKFCATGQLGFQRNLIPGEIVDQVTAIRSLAKKEEAELSNIVFMGMGEPYLNYPNVQKAIDRITSADGLGMSPQRITVSSVGIPKMIRQMADDNAKYHFALSLHAANDHKRSAIIPFNLKFPLAEITDALKYYHQKTTKRITIEYILFDNFNDSVADAAELARFCRSFPVKINIIEYNPVLNTDFKRSTREKMEKFVAYLESRNMVVNVRQSKGKDIDAACGQLANLKGISN